MRVLLSMGLVVLLSACSGEPPLELADGSNARLEHWADRTLVINYWAEWCAPCRHEIPELNELHAERVTTGAVVIGVNYDNITGPDLAELVERMGIEFPVVVADPRERWGYELPQVLPTTVIIAPEGTVHAELVGPQTAASIKASLPGA